MVCIPPDVGSNATEAAADNEFTVSLMLVADKTDVNVFAPVMVCSVETNTVSAVDAPADPLSMCTLYPFTVVLDPDVDAACTVTVCPDSDAVNVSWSVPFELTIGPVVM